jgi:Leishmanolysin
MRHWVRLGALTLGAAAAFACASDLTEAGTESLLKVAGDNQTGPAGTTLTQQVRVRVDGGDGAGIPGRTVTFVIEAGNGSLAPTSAVSDANGEASTLWTLGVTPGQNRVTASVSSLTPVEFTATGTAPASGFDIELRYLTSATTAQRNAFDAAVSRWRQVVTGDVISGFVNAPAGQCGSESPALNETIDDLVIFVSIEPIDGPGGTLGSAGPCFIRSVSKIPLVGRMHFDSADLLALQSSNNLGKVILHEMGHALGIGTLWSTVGMLADPAETGGSDPHFTGTLSVSAFDSVGGTSYSSGAKVPVENTGGEGTQDVHWRESVFDTELMTGFLDAGTNPLSRVTVASLEDLGYVVNRSAADPFNLTAPAAASVRGSEIMHLINDVYQGPVYLVDATGRMTRVRQ